MGLLATQADFVGLAGCLKQLRQNTELARAGFGRNEPRAVETTEDNGPHECVCFHLETVEFLAQRVFVSLLRSLHSAANFVFPKVRLLPLIDLGHRMID